MTDPKLTALTDKLDAPRHFTQKHYTAAVRSLDRIMDQMLKLGMTEDQARKWLRSFLRLHYFKVWRDIQSVPPRWKP